MKNARRMDKNITIGWVPDGDDLMQLKALGYRTLVDVRDEGEKFGGQVQRIAEKLEFNFVNIAIDRDAIKLEDVMLFCRVVYRKENAPLYVFSRFGKKPLAFLMLFEAVARGEPLFRVFQRASRLGVDLRGDLALQTFLVEFFNSDKREKILELIREVRPELVEEVREEALRGKNGVVSAVLSGREEQVASNVRQHRGCTVWLTGPPFAGKRTIAVALRKQLSESGFPAYVLDPDAVLGEPLDGRLGSGDAEVFQVGQMAKVLADAGMIVAASVVSPRREDRALARGMHMAQQLGFVEVFVDAPADVLRRREAAERLNGGRNGKSMAASRGDLVYEPPKNPTLVLETALRSPDELAAEVVAYLGAHGHLGQTVSA